jgi:magnesium-transporting ATPase (P-type)
MIEQAHHIGLTSEEAAARLAADGPNELARAGRRSGLRIALEVLREPMLALLLALGSATVLCTDKYRTLTENRKSLDELWLPSGKSFRIERGVVVLEPNHALTATAALASAADLTDPLDIALRGVRAGISKIASSHGALMHAYALRSDLLAMSNIRENAGALAIGLGVTLLVLLEGCKPLVRRLADRLGATRQIPAAVVS